MSAASSATARVCTAKWSRKSLSSRKRPGLGRLVHRLGHLRGGDAARMPTAGIIGIEGDEGSAARRRVKN